MLVLFLLFMLASFVALAPKPFFHEKTKPMQMSLIQAVADDPVPTARQPVSPTVTQPPVEPRTASSLVRSEPRLVPAHVEPEMSHDQAAPIASPQPPQNPAAKNDLESAPVAVSVRSVAAPDRPQSIEATYVNRVREHLKSIKRYPTGREASLQRPSGVVEVWFVLNRNGELLDMGIEDSSGSMLLDAAARTTVRRGEYPRFQDEAWSGKAQHRFTVELDFYPAN